jgi:hypothetical protein
MAMPARGWQVGPHIVQGLCSRQGSALVLSGTLLLAGSAAAYLATPPAQLADRSPVTIVPQALAEESPVSLYCYLPRYPRSVPCLDAGKSGGKQSLPATTEGSVCVARIVLDMGRFHALTCP